jgi:hypothetical protein
MPSSFRGLIVTLAAAAWLAAAQASAVNITLDYSYDTGFFGPGTQARATLQAATSFYSAILNDTLAAIQTPAPTFTGIDGGTMQWSWLLNFNHPGGLGTVSLPNGVVGADQFIIYPGSKLYTDSTLAIGSAAGAQVFRNGPQLSTFKSPEIAEIDSIHAELNSTVTRRGEESGFATWGGSISFDSDTNWHLNHTTPPSAGKIDLYTVAIHEIAHTLGFGVSPEWTALVSGSTFNGVTSKALYGGPVPLAAGNSHWQDGVGSTVFGGAVSQTTVMTAGISPNVRRKLTALDAAALADIGWSVVPPSQKGDYNGDGMVNAADYTVWRNTLGQSGMGLAADGNNNQQIDAGDYSVWRMHYGEGAGSGTGNGVGLLFGENGEVPEPGSLALLLWAMLIASVSRRKFF